MQFISDGHTALILHHVETTTEHGY